MHPIKLLFKTSIIPALTYKKGALIFVAAPLSFLLDWMYTGSFLGFSLSFVALFTLLIIGDFFTGIWASRFEGKIINPDDMVYTFYKITLYVGFFWIILEINNEMEKLDKIIGLEFLAEQAKHLIAFLRNFIFIILNLREYLSIGNNIKRRYGRRPYLFEIVEKIAEIIEKKLITKIEESDYCPPKKEKPNQDEL